MKSDLDLLIELLEAEKQALEALMKENTDEFEYLSVYHHSEALARVNQQLYRLYNFKGPLYAEKEKLDHLIKVTQNLDGYLADIYQERVETQKAFVHQLSNQQNQWFTDDQKIDDALFHLYQGKINRFKFYISRTDNFYLTFTMAPNQILNITLRVKALNDHEDNFQVKTETNQPIAVFIGLGFKLNTDKTELKYQYEMNGFKNAAHLKTLLAYWVYDIFTFFDLSTAAIEFE